MDDEQEFRFIVTGKYKSVSVDGENFNINDSYYVNGSVFVVKNNKIVYDNDKYVVIKNGKVRMGLDEDNAVEMVSIGNGLYVLEYDGCYLNDSLDLQDDMDQALVVQGMLLDEFNSMKVVNVDRFDDEDVSADGVPLREEYMFCFNMCEEEANLREFQDKLTFGSDHCIQGESFRLIDNNGVMIIQSVGTNRYLNISKEEGDYSVFFTDDIPNHPISIVPVDEETVFVIGDGEYYYKVEFYKASYGELVRVSNIKKATRFQFISVKYRDD